MATDVSRPPEYASTTLSTGLLPRAWRRCDVAPPQFYDSVRARVGTHHRSLWPRGPAAPGDRELARRLAQGRRQDIELHAVLGDRAPRDSDAALAQAIRDFGVGKRRVLVLDELFDDVLHAERWREEMAEGDDLAIGQHDVLSGRRSAHRRFVDAELLGDRRAAEGLQMAHPLGEEVALALDQAASDVVERLAALVDVGDEQL